MSTCLRVEVVVAGGPAQSAAVMAAVYGDAGLADAATVRTEEEAFWYLCRLAAGLESPIVGEREIFAQFRQAVATFEEWTTGQALSRALQRAVGVARSVRRSLPSTDGSLASLAVHHAAAFDQVAVLGSGAMARAAASALGRNVTMFARRPESVAGVAIRPWSEVADALDGFPALIAAIPGTADAIGLADARQIVQRRADPLLVVDLGMPPALAELAGLPSVRYVGIDDLAASSQEQPPPAVVASARMEAARAWRQLAADERVGSVIADLIDQADAAVRDEVQRFAHRIAAADDPEPVLHQMAHTVARRILHRPISYLSSSEHEQAVEILEQAFGVER